MDGIEIVAVDGGSSDRTIEIFESYAGRLPLRDFSFANTWRTG